MDDLMLIIGVAGLFLLRIGIPVLLLITLGILIDRWQTKRENAVRQFQDRHYGERRYDATEATDSPETKQPIHPETADRKPVEQH